MATLQLLARCRTSGSGSSLNSAKISLAALGARTVLCCLLILKLFPPFQMTYEKRPLLERSIPECRGRSRCLLCIAQSSFQQQSTPNVVFLTRGFYLGHFCTAFYAHIIPNISPFAHYKRRLQRGGFAPRIELAFGDSASLRGIRGEAGASEMRPYQDGAYPPAEGSPKGRLRGVRMWRGQG